MSDIVSLAHTYVCDLNPYRPGMPIEALAREYGIAPERIIKLASNENPLGMSPKARAAATQAMDGAHRYPDGYDLRRALADFYGMSDEQIVLGNGSNDVLDLVARAFLGPAREAVSAQHAFIVYKLVTQITGATNVIVPAKDFGHDLKAMRASVTPKTSVVWIANPNNPTGTFVPYAEVEEFIASLPEEVSVVLDEAYYEFLSDVERVDTTKWLAKYPNLVLTRTFSKAYGLAGLRVGYALASTPVADLLNRVRQAFNSNHIGLAAALAALDDQAFVHRSVAHNHQGLKQLSKGLKQLGLDYLPSYGNFIAVRIPKTVAVHEALLRQGIIIRPVADYELPGHLRVSVGTTAENSRFLKTLEAILKQTV
jgi:histidinol-phosphate aminotransferase